MTNKGSQNLALLGLLILMLSGGATGQSTDPSNPTAFIAPQYAGKGPSTETNYYFSFKGGPGKTKIRLELKAKQFSTFARMEVFDAGIKTLATLNMNAATTTGVAEAFREIDLTDTRTIVLKITFDANLASYKIDLSGAVIFDSAVSTATSGGDEQLTTNPNGKLSKVGKSKAVQAVSVPKTGTLIVRMKNGTSKEFLLEDVKSVTVEN
jgi:hypothetical protein